MVQMMVWILTMIRFPMTVMISIDTDNDGVGDDLDVCPRTNTSSGIAVDSIGCALNQLDSDGDGVSDDIDICPGFNDTIDTDGNGIPDDCDDNLCR